MVSEQAAGRRQPDDENELVVTRERLASTTPVTPATPTRAFGQGATQTPDVALSSKGEPGGRGDARAEAVPDEADPPGASDAPRLIWERRLSRREKALRGGGMVALVGLLLYLLLGGPAATIVAVKSAGDTLNARLHPPKPQPTLADSGYTAVRPPPGAFNLSSISIAPVMGAGAAAWACWASPYIPGAAAHAWTAHAYYTADAGGQWRALALPTSGAMDCQMTADGDHSPGALAVLSQGLAPDGSCIAPFLYLTGDGGATWTPAPWPVGPSDGACQVNTALEDGVIYAWSHSPILRDLSQSTPPTGRFIVSRDGGRSWAPADNGLNDSAGLEVIGFRPGGRVLAAVPDTRGGSAGASTLMESGDYGATWSSLGTLSGAFPQVYVSSDPSVTDHGGWGRLYALAESETNGVPDGPSHLYLATAYIGQGWLPIASPPLLPDTLDSPQSRATLVIGLGPGASLEAERGIVDAPNSQLGPARRLWVWDPATGAWALDPQITPGNLALRGVTWQAGAQVFWLTTLQLGVPPTLQIYTKTYPADLARHIRAGPTS